MTTIEILNKIIEINKKLILLFQELIKQNFKDFEKFKKAMRVSESGDNYRSVNSLGYLGAYQFGMARLCDFGLTKRISGTTNFGNDCFEWEKGYSKEQFLNNPLFQDMIFKKHVIDLARRIKENYSVLFDKIVHGVPVSLSGLVAGAHLGGMGGIKKFIEGGDSSDIYGTSVAVYIRKFEGYDLNSIL